MQSYKLNWILGYTNSCNESPKETFPAKVPGSVQQDYAAYKGWPPYYYGDNFKDYGWMEDVYWHYCAPLDFSLQPGQCASLLFKGIDYKYQISVNEDILYEGEGMFSHVSVDVTAYAGKKSTLKVLIYPVPKADNSGTRTEARLSCKSAACYGWDWHPRLVTAGLWDEVTFNIQDTYAITNMEVSYKLNDSLDTCIIQTFLDLSRACGVKLTLSMAEQVIMEKLFCAPLDIVPSEDTSRALTADASLDAYTALPGYTGSYSLTLTSPQLWNPSGYGRQPIYTLTASTLTPDGEICEQTSRKIGFCRSKLVMNEGSWDLPDAFPKSRSDAPATFEINGQRIFAKGSNWVNAQIFPGEMTAEHYNELLTLVKDAHMNILRIWGGGFINKESFYDLCDEKGIMVWQEFPLACNEYPDDEHYLGILEKEAVAIVKRLRTHPCLVLWCGGNELFNNWSKMTDQHHALRLLDAVCYREDKDTPFIMTSPLNGMAHGHYMNYDEETGEEFISLLTRSHNTAYTEFGCPAVSDSKQIKSFMSPKDYEEWGPDNEVWVGHHGFHAWRAACWVRIPEVEYFYTGYTDKEDLFKKTEFLQCMSYRSCFEEMRRQWPHCAMALNWCFNEPWPTIGNNSLISWPDKVRPAYYAVKASLRPTLASLRVDHHLWHAGDTFQAEIWMLHDALEALEGGSITVSYSLGNMPYREWGTVRYPDIAPQTNFKSGMLSFVIPKDFEGEIHVKLCVEEREELSSEYTYLCKAKISASTEGMLNV